MTIDAAKLFRKVALTVVLVGILGAVIFSLWPDTRPELVATTRQELRSQGFKTDLNEFDFSTSPELRAREAALMAFASNRTDGLPRQWPDLMEPAGSQSAVVVWNRQLLNWPGGRLPGMGEQVTWAELSELLQDRQQELNAACLAAISGPIRFNLEASHGSYMLLRHLGELKNLQQAFAARELLALHEGNRGAAWTNLLATTRLVTAWEPEPAEVSHLVRFAMTKLAFDAAWQALHTNTWSDQQLAQLQGEWETVDFWKLLPETAAFERASHTAVYELERKNPQANPGVSFSALLQGVGRSPLTAWSTIRYWWNQRRYVHGGQYEEQRDLLLFDRQREVELRAAVHAPTWAQMQQLPGVTNHPVFQTKYHSRIHSLLNTRQIGLAFQRGRQGMLGRAAEAEAQRTILLTALALERYRARQGVYPKTLEALAPEFLKRAPLDFMDGKPLRYRLPDEDHYLLYSVGADGADDGGNMAGAESPGAAGFSRALPTGDIVWPLPASTGAVTALRREQSAGYEENADERMFSQALAQWQHALNHQQDVEKVLAAPASNPPDVSYRGRPLSQWLRPPNSAETNHFTLREMLTLKTIRTGNEPEWVTFELPLSYDALQTTGEIYLLIDTNNDESDEGCVVQKMECRRGQKGNCLLAWNTIYESPGKHALRAGLRPFNPVAGAGPMVGPPLPFALSNLCQFSANSDVFDPRLGAAFLLKLPETNGQYVLKCQTTNGIGLRTITGATSNGIVKIRWDLNDDRGQRFAGSAFDTLWTITLPGSGRIQTLRGP